MTGVEILTSAQVVVEAAFNWTVCGIVFGTIFLVFLIADIGLIVSGCADFIESLPLLITGLIFGAIVGGGIGDTASKPIAYETQYKVTISDEVSLNDFNERYEVIEQDGKIFTVREKTTNER